MLSNKAKYALKALFHLAEHHDGRPMLVSDIARDQNIPKRFLDAILLEMRNSGLVLSRKGPGGGYLLARGPEEISIGTVVRLIDGPLAPIRCVSVTAYHRCEDCPDEAACHLRKLMGRVRDAIAAILDNATVADAIKAGGVEKITERYEA